MVSANKKKVTIPAASLTKATITLRDAVLAGGAIVTAALVGGAAWNDINKDVKALKEDVSEIRSHQREATQTLAKIMQLVGGAPERK